MKMEVIYLIVPFSKPKFLKNVIENFNQQTYKNKKLIIVENGDGIGTCKDSGFKPDVLLKSDPHQSYARNEAVNWIKSNGGGMCANFDDDDYYGPEYISEIMNNRNKADIIGKYNFYLRNTANRLVLFEGVASNEKSKIMHGATIATMADKMPEYRNTGRWGEDWDLIERMFNMGNDAYVTSKNNFMVRRFASNHTWKVTDDQMIQTIYQGLGSRRKSLIIKDFGPENDKTLDIVNGNIKEPKYKTIKPRENYLLEDSPAYTLLSKKMKSFDEFINDNMNKSSN